MRLSTQNCVVAVLAFLALGGSAYPVKAQGLGDVARKEEERRKDVKAPAKVYTNKDLGSVPDAPSGTFSSPAASGAASTEAPKDTTSKKDTTSVKSDDAKDKSGPTKDQAYWSGRKKDLQTKLDSDQTLADALQSRINALNTDFVNRDDPVQRAGIDRDRQKANSELDRLKKSIQDGKKALSDLDEEARKAGVPAGWLR
jgi:hypothetical protein